MAGEPRSFRYLFRSPSTGRAVGLVDRLLHRLGTRGADVLEGGVAVVGREESPRRSSAFARSIPQVMK